MDERTTIDRVRALFAKVDEQQYAPVHSGSDTDVSVVRRPPPVVIIIDDDEIGEGANLPVVEFSWVEYFQFMLLGVAMLWAW